MSNIASVELSNLMAARRLMEIEKNAELRRSGQSVQEKSALDYYEEDQAYISDSALTAQKQGPNSLPPFENMNIKLSDLHKKAGNNGNAEPAWENPVEEGFVVTGSQSVEVKLEMRYRSNTPLEGLLVSSRYAQGDVIYAGGDGNDWFDAGNKLIWGKTTGAVLTQRPSALLEFYYKQTISQSITVQAVTKNA